MKRRIISLLCVATLLLSMFPVNVYASQEITGMPVISVEQLWGTRGQTIDVDISIANNPGILGGTFSVSWADGLELISAKKQDAFDELNYQKPSSFDRNGTNFIWYGDSISEILDGDILTLTFEIADDVVGGENLFVNIVAKQVIDTNKQTIQVNCISGGVQVVDFKPGDVNGDKVVDLLDVITLVQYVSDDCMTKPDGFNISLNESAANVNDDGAMDLLDVILICQYVSDGCVTNPDGYNVTLKPPSPKCRHTMEYTPYEAPTCTKDGNASYYYCTTCGKYYNDSTGSTELTMENIIMKATGHNVVIDPAIAPTYNSWGKTEGSHCANCGEVFVKQTDIPPIEGFAITYEIAGSNEYLAKQTIENPNPNEYYPEQNTITLIDLKAPAGFTFLGWYDAPQAVGGNRVTEIPKGSTGDKKLYAHWYEEVYDVTYKLYQTPLGPIENERFLHYTVSKGLKDLPNPELYNYIFLGWYMEDGTEATEIPVGTTGDITLNAYWTSKRNLTKSVGELEDPFVIENSDNGVFYFVYELGTIENVPLSEPIWTIQSVAGLAQQHSVEVSTSISEEKATEISEMISKSTVDSATWTLSKEWNDVTEVNEEWAEEHGMTQEEAIEKATSVTGTYSVTDSNGGSKTKSENDGTTTVEYASKNTKKGDSQHLDAKISGSYSNEGSVTSKVAGTYEVGLEVGGGLAWSEETDKHTGKDTTTVDTEVNETVNSWNRDVTSSTTESESVNESVTTAMSQIISNTKGYGKSYSVGGENSEAQEFSSTDSKSVNSASTLTYFTSETKTTTTTYSTDGKSEGNYRLVIAGTVHVFGVVGYDVATKSYFTYTYNVLDDKTYEFLDFSPSLTFDDNENGALPFEIPYLVYEYVAEKTVTTKGLQFTTDSETGTAKLTGYTNTEVTDVIVPTYISSGNTAYKVTEMSASAFAGKTVRSIILGDYIDEIPAGAFKDCTELEQISGCFTVIGDEAFSGCVNLENFKVSSRTREIGEDAFLNVPSVRISVLNADEALKIVSAQNPDDDEKTLNTEAQNLTQIVAAQAVESGANQIVLDLSETIKDTVFTIDVGAMTSFEVLGGKRTYKNLCIKSAADTTILRELTINECSRVPLVISSDNLVLEVVKVESAGYALLWDNENPNITLIRDNSLKASKNAVVCKYPVINSKILDQAVGTLAVSGNMYVCGTDQEIKELRNSDYLAVNNGAIIQISVDEYPQYIKGTFNVSFDANNGTVDVAEKTVYFGQSYGELPVPKRTGYDFVGWFTAVDGGKEITADTIVEILADQTLYAHWDAMAYSVNWESGEGYTINVNRTASPYANAALGELSNGAAIFYGDVLDVSYAANTGFTITEEGNTTITVTENVTSSEIYAAASANAYKVSWDNGAGYSVEVTRTSSPYMDAATGVLNNGDTVYYGDTLHITYNVKDGYALFGNGSTSVTVTGDVTSNEIYADVTANSYTYNIVYKSSNGTNLGSSTATYKFGTTNTISAPVKSGYNTPGAQTVVWDSTSAKTITFVYSPKSVATQNVTSGTWVSWTSGRHGVSYNVKVEYGQRTSSGVQVRVVWTNTAFTTASYIQYGYGQYFTAVIGGQSTGSVEIASASSFSYTYNGVSSTGTSGWITVPVSATSTSTGISLSWNDQDGISGSWSGSIPVPTY